jgi:hypothetical protein
MPQPMTVGALLEISTEEKVNEKFLEHFMTQPIGNFMMGIREHCFASQSRNRFIQISFIKARKNHQASKK